MKKIALEDIWKKQNRKDYESLYQYILDQIAQGHLKPVKASRTNGRKPALYNMYWKMEDAEEKEELKEYRKELQFYLTPLISIDYYLAHLTQYEEDRRWVLLLDDYLKKKKDRLLLSESMNERSFEIWQREKFLKKEQGKKILTRCGISMEQLHLYDATEPLVYYTHSRKTPQKVLILENKDPFYSMRKHLLDGNLRILGEEISTLIYGAGKGILKSFRDFSICVEPYLQHPKNELYYFGDLDYEGIGIYENLAASFLQSGKIKPFIPAYQAMLMKYSGFVSFAEKGTEKEVKKMSPEPKKGSQFTKKEPSFEETKVSVRRELPKTKEKQNQNIQGFFFSCFSEETQKQMRDILKNGWYIPQEILNIHDL